MHTSTKIKAGLAVAFFMAGGGVFYKVGRIESAEKTLDAKYAEATACQDQNAARVSACDQHPEDGCAVAPCAPGPAAQLRERNQQKTVLHRQSINLVLPDIGLFVGGYACTLLAIAGKRRKSGPTL